MEIEKEDVEFFVCQQGESGRAVVSGDALVPHAAEERAGDAAEIWTIVYEEDTHKSKVKGDSLAKTAPKTVDELDAKISVSEKETGQRAAS